MGEETKGLEVENHRQHTNVDEKEVKRKVNKFSRVHTCVSAWKAVSYPLCLSLSLSLTLSSKLKCRKVCFFSTLNHPIYFWVSPLSSSHFLVLVLNWVEKRRGHRHNTRHVCCWVRWTQQHQRSTNSWWTLCSVQYLWQSLRSFQKVCPSYSPCR